MQRFPQPVGLILGLVALCYSILHSEFCFSPSDHVIGYPSVCLDALPLGGFQGVEGCKEILGTGAS